MMTLPMVSTLLADSSVTFGGWDWTGHFTTVDLIAASTKCPQRSTT